MNKYQGIQSDQYFLNEDKFKKMDSMFGIKSGPVDINGACVEMKEGTGLTPMSENLRTKLEYNMHERFGLCTKEDNEY